jgi:hypothetical protein
MLRLATISAPRLATPFTALSKHGYTLGSSHLLCHYVKLIFAQV